MPDPRFLIVIPTIRAELPPFAATMAEVRASLTLPTDLRILDGSSGKAQTLDRALAEILPASAAEIYVTMDDDYVPPHGWQDLIACGFAVDPKWGALALWLGDDDAARHYMLAHYCGPLRRRQGVSYRSVPHNLVGCMIAFRREVALKIGPTPPSDERYQVWEDGYRCARARKLGYRLAYLVGEPPRLVAYDDTEAYRASKIADIEHAIPRITDYMRSGGVGPTIAARVRARIRGLVARLRGFLGQRR